MGGPGGGGHGHGTGPADPAVSTHHVHGPVMSGAEDVMSDLRGTLYDGVTEIVMLFNCFYLAYCESQSIMYHMINRLIVTDRVRGAAACC